MSPAGCFQSRGKSRRFRNENKEEEEEYRVRVLQQMIWLREKERRRLVEEEQEQESLLLRQLAAVRDEAVVGSKWKHLYFAIKVELDRLILTTTNIDNNNNNNNNNYYQELEREVRGKEEEIRVLESRIAFLEQQELRRLREVDILRQSLKIMFYNHKNSNKALSFHLK